jgi:uncharacterized delta-60 repeat protein
VGYDPCDCTLFAGGLSGIHRAEDGSLLLVGWAAAKPKPNGKRSADILVLRYRDDGTPGVSPADTGIDLIDLGGHEHVQAVAFPAGEGSFFVAGSRNNRLLVAKVKDRGAALAVESFAAPTGWATPDVGGAASEADAIAIDADGRLVVAGWVENDGDRDLLVARVLPSGALDEHFGKGGVVTFARPGPQAIGALALLPDGRIVVATGDGGLEPADTRRLLLLRLLPDGALDPTFGDGGLAFAPLGHHDTWWLPPAMVQMKDGRLVVGSTGSFGGVEGPVIARFLPDGALDPSFGDRGEVTFAVKAGPGWTGPKSGEEGTTTVMGLALAPDERRLLISGSWESNWEQGFVARLWL